MLEPFSIKHVRIPTGEVHCKHEPNRSSYAMPPSLEPPRLERYTANMNPIARATVLGFSLALFGTACGPVLPGPGPARCTANPCSSVNLSSDPRTLQGVWSGDIAVPQLSGETPQRVPIRFELAATYKDEFYYTLSGTATLEGKTYPVRGTHTFDNTEKILRPQTLPIPQPNVFELLEGDKVIYTVPYLFWQKDKNQYGGALVQQNLPSSFELTLQKTLP